jgi:PAS domain S-box-containing protein
MHFCRTSHPRLGTRVNTDPQTLHAETFEEISRLIQRDVDSIIEQWEVRAAEEQPTADPSYRAEMHDRLPAFLHAVALSLRQADSDENGPHRLLALEHGEQRWRVGWKLSEVVRDYQILRLVLLRHLDHVLPRPLTVREAMAVGLLLDEAIGAAVVMFSSHHDRAIGAAEEQFRDVMEGVADALMVFDTEGALRLVNPATERLFGVSSDELLGAKVQELLNLSDPQATDTWSRLLATDRTAKPWRGQAVARRNDGGNVAVEIVLSELHREERSYWIATIRDMSELTSLNHSLERLKSEADASNQAKSEFLANMSHEIRTPMTAILGYVELLRDELQNPRHVEAMNTIQRNADFLLEIINDVLDLSKIEARKFEIQPANFSPLSLTEEIASLMAVAAQTKGIRLITNYETQIPESIESDPKRLREILINLVGNAIKFTDQGEVRLSVALREHATGPQLTFAVRDTGIGMSPDEVMQVFQPFWQVNSATGRRAGGTGLGLTISKHLAELLGGSIEVESRQGSGSTFRLTLPTGSLVGVTLIEPSEHTVEVRVNSGNGDALPQLACRVLAVDDRRDNQLLIKEILRKAGAVVTVASDGRTAIDLITKANTDGEAFDVVLMDMHMPELDGYAATTELRAQGHRLPIIALTASAMKGDHERCLEVGCDDYLPKPIDFRRLVELVARHVKSGPL